MFSRFHIILILLPLSGFSQSEFIINKGVDVRISPGCQVIFAEGGIQNEAGQLSNAGELVVEGNLLNDGLLAGGTSSGVFRILNDIENNGQMQEGQSLFELYGNDQFISGSQQLNFYDLTLVGNGIKFALQNIRTTGTLDLTDRELRVSANTVFHENPNATSVFALHDMGFISATFGGGLMRTTNSSSDYFFPVGTSEGTFRVRPVIVAPGGGTNKYKVRFANGLTPNALQRGSELYYVNSYFYHVVERTDGQANTGLSVFYDEVQDGAFETLAHYEISSALWRENVGTIEGTTLGSGPELSSFKTDGWNFSDPEIALAALSTEIWLPNVFSPNDDGQNDVFKPRGTEPFDYEMRIYDRWGNLVFESKELDKGWDGTFNNNPMNSGVFVYYILSAGEVINKGNVTLVR